MKNINDVALNYINSFISQSALSNFLENNIDEIDVTIVRECEEIIMENQFNIIYPNSENKFRSLVENLLIKLEADINS